MEEKGGIYSLAGFAYQIKVFILQILHLKNNYTLEYETIDDVALKRVTANSIDDYEDNLQSILTTTKRTAFQVKKTDVTNSVAKKVIKNWLLADRDDNEIDDFVLVTDRKTDNIFCDLEIDEIFSDINLSTGSKSIDAKIRLLGYSEHDLKEKIKEIISKAKIKIYEDIDKEIIESYSDFFISPAVTDATYFLRIKELIQQVTVEILDVVLEGKPYELSYEKVCEMKNDIISKITDEKWEPSFSEFRKLRKINLEDLAVIKSREYLQLLQCSSLSQSDRARHLQFGEYYVNCKRTYFERGMKNMVDDLENTAYDNFCDVKMELRNKSADSPDNRLFETKAKSNSKAVDEQIKYGVCINLTSESTDESIQISWKDD